MKTDDAILNTLFYSETKCHFCLCLSPAYDQTEPRENPHEKEKKNQRRRKSTGSMSCCAKREIRCKVGGKEKCFSGCKEKEVSKGPCGYVPGKAGVVCPRGVKGVCCIANWWSLVNCWRVWRESRTKRLLIHRSHREMKPNKKPEWLNGEEKEAMEQGGGGQKRKRRRDTDRGRSSVMELQSARQFWFSLFLTYLPVAVPGLLCHISFTKWRETYLLINQMQDFIPVCPLDYDLSLVGSQNSYQVRAAAYPPEMCTHCPSPPPLCIISIRNVGRRMLSSLLLLLRGVLMRVEETVKSVLERSYRQPPPAPASITAQPCISGSDTR